MGNAVAITLYINQNNIKMILLCIYEYNDLNTKKGGVIIVLQ